MLSEKQLSLACAEPKNFLKQYRPVQALAQLSLERAERWQPWSKAFCADLIQEARNRFTLAKDIADTIERAEIDAQYKMALKLRFIEGFTAQEAATEMGYTKRWFDTIQHRALIAFAQSTKERMKKC